VLRSIRDTHVIHYTSTVTEEFFSFPKRPNRFWASHSLLFNRYRSYFPYVKRREREVGYSPPSNAEVKNEWSSTSTSLICLHVLGRGNFPFYCCVGHCAFSVVYKSKGKGKVLPRTGHEGPEGE
jgi:hypothetical protein